MKTIKSISISMILAVLLLGCNNKDIQMTETDKTFIENYIRDKHRTGGSPGNTFVVMDILGSDRSKEEIYIWALIEDYSFSENGAELESGASMPIVLDVNTVNDALTITESRIPRDGSMYSDDIKELFPKRLQDKMFDYSSNHMEGLIDEMATKAEKRLLLSPEHRLAVEKAIEYVMESPWENRLRIDFSKVNIEEAPAELADSLWTHNGPEVSKGINPGDLLVELGSGADHDFAGLIFDIEKGEIIGYLSIQ